MGYSGYVSQQWVSDCKPKPLVKSHSFRTYPHDFQTVQMMTEEDEIETEPSYSVTMQQKEGTSDYKCETQANPLQAWQNEDSAKLENDGEPSAATEEGLKPPTHEVGSTKAARPRAPRRVELRNEAKRGAMPEDEPGKKTRVRGEKRKRRGEPIKQKSTKTSSKSGTKAREGASEREDEEEKREKERKHTKKTRAQPRERGRAETWSREQSNLHRKNGGPKRAECGESKHRTKK